MSGYPFERPSILPEAGRSRHLRDQLKEAGFSGRAVSNLPLALPISDLSELRTGQWEDVGSTRGLKWVVSTANACGAQVMAEVEAYRAGLDPREARVAGPVRVSVPLAPDELAALDAWREGEGSGLSRADAVKALALRALRRGR